MSSIVNKIKEAVHSDKHQSHSHTENSSLNQPRTVGDRVSGENASYSTGENYTAGGFGSGPAPNTAGPHRSDMANKADPRIDSDRDGSNTLGRTENKFGANTYGTASHTAGPHRSDAANKLDPRVDSDRDGSRTLGGNTNDRDPTFGQMPLGHHSGQHTAGPHRSDAANKLDPRIDSDRDGSYTVGDNRHTTFGQHHSTAATGFGTGPAPNTAGPHRSDMANKVDPRVDSDRDGSKTLGRDQTYSQSDDLNPRDAADVPPSVLRKHVGEVSIEHEDHGHQRERRHSKASAQDQFRGV